MLVLFFTYTWHCIPGTCALAIGAGGRFTDSSSFRAPPAGDSVGKGIGGVVGNVTNPSRNCSIFWFRKDCYTLKDVFVVVDFWNFLEK